ncbi:MAG: metal ABC transporter ATP-binding protein [Planctomycetales bacterium]|nr:metal ABC transporter ATP-binding protein [Planctomycetales bacterium]
MFTLRTSSVRSTQSSAVPAIEVQHLTVSYGPSPALLDVSFSVPAGTLVGVIGPNGSGKSTLIKSILGFKRPDFGEVRLFGESATKAIGRVAYVPQHGSVDWTFPITVRQVALMGRYGHVPWWKGFTSEDRRIADDALEMVRMSDFRQRQIGQLSGGQRQRVFMARAMAQGADILLLDEPFAGVDAATEHAILDVLETTKQAGKTLMVVHHDLATAAEYFDRILLLKQRLYAYGRPEVVLEPQLLSAVYEGNLKAFGNLGEALSSDSGNASQTGHVAPDSPGRRGGGGEDE